MLIPVISIAWTTATSGFVWDDLKNFRQAQESPLSLHYLFEPTSGHWAPGHRLGDWVVQRFFPMNFPAAMILLLIGFAACLLLFHRILAELFRPGWGPILLTLLFGASVVNNGVIQWWASGLDRIPALFFSFVCILGYLRFHRTRQGLWLAVSVLALCAAFCFYIKPIFVPVYLVLIRILLLDPDQPLRDNVKAALREWLVWVPYVAAVAAFGVIYVKTYPTGLNQTPTGSVFVRYLGLLWFRVVVPNLVGFFVPLLSNSALAVAGIVLAQLVLVAAVVLSIRRSPRAGRAWAFFAVGFAANATVVGMTRIGFFSPRIIAHTIYYNLEITFLFFIALGGAFLRGRELPWAPPKPAVAAAVAVSLAFSFYGAVRLNDADLWVGRRARVFTDNASASLTALRRAGRNVALIDSAVPEDVVPRILAPYNSYSELFPLLDDRVGYDAAGHDLYAATTDGHLVPVAFAPVAGGNAVAELQAGRLGVVGATIEADPRGPGGFCITASKGDATIGYALPQPVKADGLSIRMTFRAESDFTMSLLGEPVGGHPPGRVFFRIVNIHPTERETVYPLGEQSATYVAAVVARGARICVSRFEVGVIARR